MSEQLLDYEATTQLAVEEVLAVQSLVMQVVRPTARRTVRKEGMHRFVFYESAGQGALVGSDETERFIAISAGRKSFRNWAMRVSFLELILSREKEFSSCREMYSFDWDSEGNCHAVKRLRDNRGIITGYVKVDDELPISNEGEDNLTSQWLPFVDYEQSEMQYPLETTDCDELSDRLLEVVNSRNLRRVA